MTRLILTMVSTLALVGCGDMAQRMGLGSAAPGADAGDMASAEDGASGTSATLASAPRPPASATNAETLDTTTPEQRAAATAPSAGAGRQLGNTVVSLGSPTEPGLWLKTPLVKAEQAGRVTNPKTGKSAQVTLIPIEGPPTAGSRMSLAALRLLGASLTDLTEMQVALAG
ncbi:hypothetical protein ACFSUD_03215 [Sulfitobacter aestuarii]|uniref:D-galactarate dehydratase n=1 Tax=Sulfitobacter aestuarii TaxID=2161676 RepID=A0ABW5TY53_9RHOB